MVTEKIITIKKITITLPPKLINEFKIYCGNNGMNVSKRIALLMRKDLRKTTNENQ